MSRAEHHVIVVSGLSGGGKSTALNALEDIGYYCIDNLPAALLDEFPPQLRLHPDLYRRVALGIDARAGGDALAKVPDWIDELKQSGLACELLFLTADTSTLLKRFSETRRRHPLTAGEQGLASAIAEEQEILEPIREASDQVIDTSNTNIHQLRHLVWKFAGAGSSEMSVVLESFAFKNGVPQDVDFVFDARNLPNPFWEDGLKDLTGQDDRVGSWLEDDEQVRRMGDDIFAFLQRWLPGFAEVQRSYVTVGIGCTGGRHRSVYLVERLAKALREDYPEVLVQHRELTL